MKESFIFYKSWSEALAKLPNDVRLEVLDAVINYAFTGEEPQFANPVAEIAFSFIKLDIERNTAKYEATCEKRKKAVKARWEKFKNQQIQMNTNDTNEYKRIQTDTNDTNVYKCIQTDTNAYKPIQTHTNAYKPIHNDNDNENVNVNVNEDENEDENGNGNDNDNGVVVGNIIINDVPPTTNNNNKNKRKSTRFAVPTLAEVQEYISANHYSVDAQRFLDYYTANGWMIGRAKVKDWKACVRTWQRNERTMRSSASDLTLKDNSKEKYDDDSLKW